MTLPSVEGDREKPSRITGNLGRRLGRLEAELAPPRPPEMMEIQFIALVGGEILHRMFIPKRVRGRSRPWPQNASADSSSVSQEPERG